MRGIRKLLKVIAGNRVYQIITFMFFMVVLFVGYIYIGKQIDRMLEAKEHIFSWVYQVDEIKQEKGNLIVTGWAFELEKDALGDNFEIVLMDTETGKFYFPNMTYSARKDVNEYFLCEYNYIQSGFTATIPLKKLDLEESVYEIMLRLKEDTKRNAYSMSVYYADNQMQFANPKEFIEPDIKGTELEQIVENGVLRTFNEEYQTWVYQYEGELYWITEGNGNFGEEDWLVQFQMNTTQINNLPQHRLDNGHYWSNIGFYFSEKEIINADFGGYRVAKCPIPIEYSVLNIWTGNYIDNWMWKNDFYPWYEFNNQ